MRKSDDLRGYCRHRRCVRYERKVRHKIGYKVTYGRSGSYEEAKRIAARTNREFDDIL